MELELNGKRALVLAASSGLGRAVALGLAREGARVALCSRSLPRAQEAAEAIAAETGGEVHAFEADVADAASLAAFIDAGAAALGGVDLLVCNAGGPPPGGFEALDEEKWHRAFELTLMSVVRSVRESLPHLREAGGGSVLVLGSSSVKVPIPNLLLSNVYRPGIQGLVKHLSAELAGDGIRVNMLSPGRILTDRIEELDAAAAERSGRTAAEVRADSVRQIPLGRLGEPGEFANAAVFLLSGAAAYVTGSSLIVDGGAVRAL
ncbi:MAG TPA: SDR family oxidoreductase [Deinococcales bacterium]|nr:SDR family oxidoreductase [Deinococcales bacterium]